MTPQPQHVLKHIKRGSSAADPVDGPCCSRAGPGSGGIAANWGQPDVTLVTTSLSPRMPVAVSSRGLKTRTKVSSASRPRCVPGGCLEHATVQNAKRSLGRSTRGSRHGSYSSTCSGIPLSPQPLPVTTAIRLVFNALIALCVSASAACRHHRHVRWVAATTRSELFVSLDSRGGVEGLGFEVGAQHIDAEVGSNPSSGDLSKR